MFSVQNLVKTAEEMKGLIDQTGGAVASPFYPTFLRPSLFLLQGINIILHTLPHAAICSWKGCPVWPFLMLTLPGVVLEPFF